MVCPHCGDQRQLIKVSAIVAAQSSTGSSQAFGTAQTSLTGMVLGQAYNSYSTSTYAQSASQSVLATMLAPAAKPDPFGESIKATAVTVVVLVLAMSWVSSALHISVPITLGAWGFVGLGWWRWYRQLSNAWELKYYRAALLWEGAYYCPKHALVVAPELGVRAVQPGVFGALVRPSFSIFDTPPAAEKPALATSFSLPTKPETALPLHRPAGELVESFNSKSGFCDRGDHHQCQGGAWSGADCDCPCH
jgi:hypothetical protein